MKKIVTVALCIIMAFALAGCGKTKTPAVLPAHNLLKEKAEQENADGITKAYIAATDAMLNYIVDEKMGSKEKLKYISFDFATNFALNSEQREKWFPPFQSTEYRQIPKAQQHIPLLHSAMKVWFSSI